MHASPDAPYVAPRIKSRGQTRSGRSFSFIAEPVENQQDFQKQKDNHVE